LPPPISIRYIDIHIYTLSINVQHTRPCRSPRRRTRRCQRAVSLRSLRVWVVLGAIFPPRMRPARPASVPSACLCPLAFVPPLAVPRAVLLHTLLRGLCPLLLPGFEVLQPLPVLDPDAVVAPCRPRRGEKVRVGTSTVNERDLACALPMLAPIHAMRAGVLQEGPTYRCRSIRTPRGALAPPPRWHRRALPAANRRGPRRGSERKKSWSTGSFRNVSKPCGASGLASRNGAPPTLLRDGPPPVLDFRDNQAMDKAQSRGVFYPRIPSNYLCTSTTGGFRHF